MSGPLTKDSNRSLTETERLIKPQRLPRFNNEGGGGHVRRPSSLA